MTARTYTLLGPNGQPYQSATPGALGGHRGARVYGRLDCRAALRAIARGQSVRNRVFFADEQTAVAAGYRPCAVCLPNEYAQWKAAGLSEVGAGMCSGRAAQLGRQYIGIERDREYLEIAKARLDDAQENAWLD